MYGYIPIYILKVTFIFSLLAIPNPKHYSLSKFGAAKVPEKVPGHPNLIAYTVTLLEWSPEGIWFMHSPRHNHSGVRRGHKLL